MFASANNTVPQIYQSSLVSIQLLSYSKGNFRGKSYNYFGHIDFSILSFAITKIFQGSQPHSHHLCPLFTRKQKYLTFLPNEETPSFEKQLFSQEKTELLRPKIESLPKISTDECQLSLTFQIFFDKRCIFCLICNGQADAQNPKEQFKNMAEAQEVQSLPVCICERRRVNIEQ